MSPCFIRLPVLGERRGREKQRAVLRSASGCSCGSRAAHKSSGVQCCAFRGYQKRGYAREAGCDKVKTMYTPAGTSDRKESPHSDKIISVFRKKLSAFRKMYLRIPFRHALLSLYLLAPPIISASPSPTAPQHFLPPGPRSLSLFRTPPPPPLFPSRHALALSFSLFSPPCCRSSLAHV